MIEFPDHVLQVACEHQRSIEVRDALIIIVAYSSVLCYLSLIALVLGEANV